MGLIASINLIKRVAARDNFSLNHGMMLGRLLLSKPPDKNMQSNGQPIKSHGLLQSTLGI